MNAVPLQMNESDLQVFIDAALEFFQVVLNNTAQALDGRIEFVNPPVNDFSGLIEVSGIADGVVYVTASRKAVSALLSMLSEDPGEDELYGDLLGELTHTIVSNARAHFGANLKVSVPHIYQSGISSSAMPEVIAYVTPLRCGTSELDLVIALTPQYEEGHSHA